MTAARSRSGKPGLKESSQQYVAETATQAKLELGASVTSGHSPIREPGMASDILWDPMKRAAEENQKYVSLYSRICEHWAIGLLIPLWLYVAKVLARSGKLETVKTIVEL